MSGLSGRELARQLGISQSKVSRIESGEHVLPLPKVSEWADATQVDLETKTRLLKLAGKVSTEVNSFQTALRSGKHLQDQIRKQEVAARTTRNYQPSLVPGLLQTPEYARQVFTIFQPVPYTEEAKKAAIAARLDRQLLLYEEDRRFDFLITEQALCWRPGPVSAHRAQFDRIAALSTLENVSIGLIPLHAPVATYFSHGFVLYEAHDDNSAFAEVELFHGRLQIHDTEELELYRKQWELLSKMAVFGKEAREFLTRLSEELAH